MKNLAGWRKSSRSDEKRDCVEVGFAPGIVGVRDTKDREGGTLAFNRSAWRAFTGGLHSGAFDVR
ncbi:DUF397 domain-containing protein [Saccharopolyspora shandongensis]|uniref:DUF397 domain-containing protein n=1 Tax=Saccharopolyspora shandongensis TaxID=418495 RepID=UPI0015A631DC|nr:DUF397 domain-containing protein [Saccharopolyspora shandongensis]